MSSRQRTLKQSFTLSGAGIHEGTPATATVRPAPVNTGFVFVRTDLPGKPEIPARPEFIGEKLRRTMLTRNGAEVHTCEHLLAGIFGVGIDNAVIELDGQEPPAMDGSAKAFADAAISAGLVEQDSARRVYKPVKELRAGDSGVSLALQPGASGEGLRLEYTLDYGLPELGRSRVEFTWTPESFAREIAPARTFCLEREAEMLKALGFGKGANTQNTLVIGPKGVLENTLRFADEFARHKVLDVIGDLAIAGCRLEGRIVAVKSGHALNQKLAAQIAKEMAAMIDGANSSPNSGNGTGTAAQTDAVKPFMDALKILQYAPHRYPFLMVDRVIEVTDNGTRVIGIKNVSFNEPYFQGHFPGLPVMPGVLQIEAMAQLGGLFVVTMPENVGKIGLLLAVEEARFRKQVVPGDQVRIEARIVKSRRGIVETQCSCSVDGETVSECTLKFMLVANEKKA